MCIDLCAAPGGWCQVATKAMPPGSITLGIDLLPIRAIRNVKTIVADITTAECRRLVQQELQGWKADVVLCDGAPNIGSSYSKDAYVQNELVLAALRTATDHLIANGTFVSKVYRSEDYNSLIWVLNQFFEEVQIMKPASSRSQSSEIFVICTGYYAPKTIDMKLLDPNHVFSEVTATKNADGTVTTSSDSTAKVDVLHKKYEQHNKRHRTGYDTEVLGPLLTRSLSVKAFIDCPDPVRKLTDYHQILFNAEDPACMAYKERSATTEEICTCLSDLRLCGKVDFKKILRWRQQMKKIDEAEMKAEESGDNESDEEDEDVVVETEESREMKIQDEIDTLQASFAKKESKQKKKAREQLAKTRQRTALGMSYNSFATEDDNGELFNLAASAPTMKDVDTIIKTGGRGEKNEEDMEQDTDSDSDSEEGIDLFASDEEPSDMEVEEGVVYGQRGEIFMPEASLEDMEDQLNEDYARHMSKKQSKYYLKKQQELEKQRKKAKENGEEDEPEELRSTTMLKKQRLANTADAMTRKRSAEDAEFYASGDEEDAGDVDLNELEAYNKQLESGLDVEEKGAVNTVSGDAVISSMSSKASKWFSHPIFEEKLTVTRDEESDEENLTMEQMMSNLPKTDKQVRHEKRLKDAERKMRKEEKRMSLNKKLQDEEELDGMSSMKVVPNSINEMGFNENHEKTIEQRSLLAKGMGNNRSVGEDNIPLKIVSATDSASASYNRNRAYDSSDDSSIDSDEEVQQELMRRKDIRTYDSDEEEYDSHDKAMHLALGTMMLNKSRAKAMIDASYNRYTYNDSKLLPAWFVDDELKHNKPQIPVPTALINQVR